MSAPQLEASVVRIGGLLLLMGLLHGLNVLTLPVIGRLFSLGMALIVAASATATTWVLRWRGVQHPWPLRAVGSGGTAAALGVGLIHLAGQVAAVV